MNTTDMEGDPIKIKEILDKYHNLILRKFNIKSTYKIYDPCKPVFNFYDYYLDNVGRVATLYIGNFNLDENEYKAMLIVSDYENFKNKIKFNSNELYREQEFEKGFEHFKNVLVNIKKIQNEIRLNKMLGDFE